MANAGFDHDAALEWRTEVSLLGQPTMLGNFVKVIAIAAATMGGLFALLSLAQGAPDEIVPLLELTAACVGLVAVIMLLVMVVIFRNRMTMAFRVEAGGARSAVVDRRARGAGKAALVVGALSGKPQLLGAGLIASSTWSQSLAWCAVRKVAYSSRWRTIKLANSWRTAMIIYCDPSNYDDVARFVDGALRASPRTPRPNPLPGLLLRSALSVAASAPLFGLAQADDADLLTPLLALTFALVSVWLFPIFAWIVIGAVAWFAVATAASGPAPGATAAVALAGAAYLVGQSVALLIGRFDSALAGDMNESAPPPTAHVCAVCGARLDAAGRCPSCGGAARR